MGAVPGPQDCFLVLRGLKTLAVRMEAHCRNATGVAEFLSGRDRVKQVYYPGLRTHPQYDLASRQMNGFGGMLAFDVGSIDAARRVLDSVRLHSLAESLGGVETLISHPAMMTHASMPSEVRQQIGITDQLITPTQPGAVLTEHAADLVVDGKDRLVRQEQEK